MKKKNKLKKIDQDVLFGSSRLLKLDSKNDDRTSYMLNNMSSNAVFRNFLKNNKVHDKHLLEKLTQRFHDYRKDWKDQPLYIMKNSIFGNDLLKNNIIPLCIDIEIAAICDLACGFCYRESIATPDKIIKSKLFYKIIDQAANLGVPSIKLNWRGEPLLHPKICDFIEYAKNKGILEVIINTNATQLTKKMSSKLINAGLDYMIYSFDGGTKETYEKMRPGRFKANKFEDVYNNIKNFSEIRKNLKAKFPRTKIQMIMTEDTFDEQEKFFNLFNEYVDEVTVTQYSERGGNFNDLTNTEKKTYKRLLKQFNLENGTPYLKDSDGKIKVSLSRKACEQPYQRLMITYDGRVSMCCFDWGAMHSIGYVDDMSFKNLDADKISVLDKVKNNKKGFELMKFIKMPKSYNLPEKKISTISEIWTGNELKKIHKLHSCGKINNVKICKGCTFKDTYNWKGE